MSAAMMEVETETGVVKYYVLDVHRLDRQPISVILALPEKNLRLMFALSNRDERVIIPHLKQARMPLDSSRPTDYRIGGKHLYPALVRLAGTILHQSP